MCVAQGQVGLLPNPMAVGLASLTDPSSKTDRAPYLGRRSTQDLDAMAMHFKFCYITLTVLSFTVFPF